MNYKEAAIAAIKYSNTVPVVINRRRVKISIAEKPPAPLIQVSQAYCDACRLAGVYLRSLNSQHLFSLSSTKVPVYGTESSQEL